MEVNKQEYLWADMVSNEELSKKELSDKKYNSNKKLLNKKKYSSNKENLNIDKLNVIYAIKLNIKNKEKIEDFNKLNYTSFLILLISLIFCLIYYKFDY